MKSCDHVDSLVSAYLEREASPAEVRFVDSHLAECSRCRQELHDVGQVLEEIARLPRVEVSPDFTERVLVRTRGLRALDVESQEPWALRPRTTRRVLQWGVPLAAVAASLALALVTLEISNRTGDSEMTASDVPPPAPVPLEPEPQSPGVNPPVVPPEVIHLGEGEGKSLGMVRDAYALGTYEVRTPSEGGTPILTPVASKPDVPVVVTF